jgi:hypothetical protein
MASASPSSRCSSTSGGQETGWTCRRSGKVSPHGTSTLYGSKIRLIESGFGLLAKVEGFRKDFEADKITSGKGPFWIVENLEHTFYCSRITSNSRNEHTGIQIRCGSKLLLHYPTTALLDFFTNFL